MAVAITGQQQTQRIEAPGADLVLFPHISLKNAGGLLQRLIDNIPWQQEDITLFGVTHPQPRLIAWYGDAGASYTYSNISHAPLAWTTELNVLRRQLEQLCEHSFNSVLLNYYRDGSDAMGLHADDEPELGPAPVIASLSIGAQRRMYFRHKRDGALETISIDLPDQSLLVMRGATQANWKHGIRRTKRACGPRINLTFRQVMSQ